MSHPCESCGMPIPTGRWCTHCTDAEGRLQDFDTRFARCLAWARCERPDLSAEQAEAKTLAWMAQMPAWADHPRVRAHRGA